MRLLLDTHIFIWCVKDDKNLSKVARNLILNAAEVYVSSVSIWEAAIKARLGKLEVDISELIASISKTGFLELSLNVKHISALNQLPNLHKDPFDQVLIAQSITEPLKFITHDEKLEKYSDLVMIV